MVDPRMKKNAHEVKSSSLKNKNPQMKIVIPNKKYFLLMNRNRQTKKTDKASIGMSMYARTIPPPLKSN